MEERARMSTQLATLVVVLLIFSVINGLITYYSWKKCEEAIKDGDFLCLGELNQQELIELNAKIAILLACDGGGELVIQGGTEVDGLISSMQEDGTVAVEGTPNADR